MVRKMLEGIPCYVSTDYHDCKARHVTELKNADTEIIYTGPIDRFFDYRYGKLEYRSLKFHFEHVDKEYVQKVGTVNYPNNYDFTRITEFKHLTGQTCKGTTLCYEYPEAYTGENVPYYPMFNDKNRALYEKYKADTPPNVHFLGRLAEFRYYDMDDVVARALTVAESLC
jgi:UDP-galactopyranose mutase